MGKFRFSECEKHVSTATKLYILACNLPFFVILELKWILEFVPLLIALYVYRQQRRKSTIKFPALALAKKAVPSRRVKFRHIVPALRLAALVCFVVALARPQNAMEVEYTSTDGVDIMLALDVSGSMGTLDMLTRTEQAKLGVMNAERILHDGLRFPARNLEGK